MMTFISSVLSFSLLIPTSGQAAAVGAGAQGNRPSVLVRASTTQQPADGGWPRAYVTTSGARLVLCEPQIASWLDQKRMAMYAAVSYTPADQSSTALGTVGTVFVSKTPAELMLLNGGAAYTPVKGTHLEWVSNTDSDVFRFGTTGTVYYLVSGRCSDSEMPAR